VKPKILILTEAGEGIGFGHLMRSQAIQNEFNRQNIDSFLLLHISGERSVFPQPINGQIQDWITEIQTVCTLGKAYQVVLVDSYLASLENYKILKEHFLRVVVLDDYCRINYPVDLVINPNLSIHDIKYDNQSSPVIGGSDFVVLRPEFLELGQQHFQIKQKIERVLVTVGGSDYRHLAPKLLTWLNKFDFQVVFIAASEEYRHKIINEFPNTDVLGYLNTRKMIQIITSVDITISAAGQTLNELAYLGVPTIGIGIDHDQLPNINWYFKTGFLLDKLYWNQSDLHNKICLRIKSLASYGIRNKVSSAGRNLINGLGARNIVKRIFDIV
jgi:UDP-2,4-diacetamido-2,4,6-trideoxy-beta-L-altropyranose hydrolase